MSTTRERIVVVGASLAGVHAASELRTLGFDGDITVVGDEPHQPYDRPPLSKDVLAGARREDELALPLDDARDVDWQLGAAATGLDLERRVVQVGPREIPFDGLVIATGVRPRALRRLAPGAGVHALRTLDDARRLHGDLLPGTRLLIVGAGFVGVEVASAATTAGCEVTIVSLEPPVAVAGPHASEVCAVLLQEAGVQLRIGRTIAGVEGEERPTAVLLDDGARVTFDAIVVAVGAVPNVEWLEGAGIALADGVVCDASLAVIGAGPIVAAGDVARWPNPATGGAPMRIERWSNAVEQGAAAARTLLVGPGPGTAHSATPSFWSDHLGVRLQSIGTLNGATRFEVIAGAPGERRFAATAYDTRDRLLGAVAYDMPREISRCRAALADHRAAVG